MPLKSGLGASVSVAKETTYGTYVAPTRSFYFNSEGLERNQTFYKNQGLSSGSVAQQKSLIRATTRTATGPIAFTAASKGMGLIFDSLTGATVTPTGSGTSKTFVFPIGIQVPDGKSYTYQVGAPDTAGTVQPKTLTGGVTQSLNLKATVGGAIECELQLIGQDIDLTTQTLATPTYPSAFEIFGFRESVLTFDGSSIGSCVKDFDVTISIPRADDRFCLNGSGTILEPITNAQMTVAGSMTCEFTGLTQYTAFKNSSFRALRLQNRGLLDIETGIKPELTLDIPSFLTEKFTPMVGGPDVITVSMDFTAAIDTGNLATITYITTDTAI